MSKILALLSGVLLYLGLKEQAGATNMVDYVKNNDDRSLDDIFRDVGSKVGLDWLLLKAIGVTESNLNPRAVNPADPSYGVMQILCTTNNGSDVCVNKLPAVSEWNGATINRLYDPSYNILIGARILAWNIDRYGFEKGIAVYNNWSARNESKPFTNQNYVDKVLANYERLK
jgi:soluble lytic murein transglycosylase-like protein